MIIPGFKHFVRNPRGLTYVEQPTETLRDIGGQLDPVGWKSAVAQ
jgi:hypothetical protein